MLILLIQAKHNESDREHNAAACEGGGQGIPGKEGDPSADGGQSIMQLISLIDFRSFTNTLCMT